MKTIIYDPECPLCEAYTSAFVKLGLIRGEERISFGELQNQEFISRIDMKRKGNEIPLVDHEGGETLYGADALLWIIGRRWPRFAGFFRKQPVYFLVKHVYALISYNRRVILARKYCSGKFSCAPEFHRGYRLAFLLVAAIIASAVSWLFGKQLAAADTTFHFFSGLRMLLLCGTGWIVWLGFSRLFIHGAWLAYAGQLAMLQVLGVAVLIPAAIVLPHLGFAGIFFAILSVMCSSALMLRGHIRRTQTLGLSRALTAGWFFSLQLTAAAWLWYFIQNPLS